MTNSTSSTYTITDTSLVAMELCVAVPAFLLLTACFLCFRKKYPSVYISNKPDVSSTEETRGEKYLLGNSAVRSTSEEGENTDQSIFSVFMTVWRLKANDIIRIAGFDAYSFTYMYWYQFLLMLFLTPLTFICLIPVYVTGDGLVNNTDYIDMVSLSNVGSSTWRIWFTLIIGFILYAGSAVFMMRAFREMSVLADAYNSDNQKEGHYTVLITELEEPYTNEDSLANCLNTLFPHRELVNVDICKDLSSAKSLWKNLLKANKRLELCQESETKTVGCCCCCYWDLEDCQKAADKAKELFYATNPDQLENITAAVVQFKSMRVAALCSNNNLTPEGGYMRAQIAPGSADEILWENLSRSKCSKVIGRNLGTAIYIFIIFSFIAIMTFLAGVVNIENIASLWTGFADVLTWDPNLTALLAGLVPSLLYFLFFLVLYHLLKALSWVSFPNFESDKVNLTLKRYSDTLIGTGLLVVLFAGSVFSISSFAVSDLWEALGVSVPSNSVTFILYVIVACFINTGVQLVMVGPFFLNLMGLYTPGLFMYDQNFGIGILMFTICTTYAVVSPLILLFGALYFFFAYMVFTYQLVYVYKKGNEYGGRLTPTVYGRLNYGMVIGQLVVTAMLVLLDAVWQSIIFLSLPILTIGICRSSLSKYEQYFGCSSLATLAESDSQLKQDIRNGVATRPVKEGSNDFIAPLLQALTHYEPEPETEP